VSCDCFYYKQFYLLTFGIAKILYFLIPGTLRPNCCYLRVKLHFCSSLSDCWCFRVFDRTSDLIVALQKNLTSFHQKKILCHLGKKLHQMKCETDVCWYHQFAAASSFHPIGRSIFLWKELLRGRRRLNEVGGKKWRDLWKKWQKINWHGKQNSKACSCSNDNWKHDPQENLKF